MSNFDKITNGYKLWINKNLYLKLQYDKCTVINDKDTCLEHFRHDNYEISLYSLTKYKKDSYLLVTKINNVEYLDMLKFDGYLDK
jgi:hypothetical protein